MRAQLNPRVLALRGPLLALMLALLLALLPVSASEQAPDPTIRLKCQNSECSEIISYAKTSIVYNAPYHYLLSFKKGSQVEVLGKNAIVWYVQIDGKKGLAPKDILKETKVKHKPTIDVEYGEIVDNELILKQPFHDQYKKVNSPIVDPIKTNPVTAVPVSNEKIATSKPQSIISEGTTIYPDASEDVTTKNLVNLNSDQSSDTETLLKATNEDDDEDESDVEDDEEDDNENNEELEIETFLGGVAPTKSNIDQNKIDNADIPHNVVLSSDILSDKTKDVKNINLKPSQVATENSTKKQGGVVNNAEILQNIVPPDTSIDKKESVNTANQDKSSQVVSKIITEQPSLVVSNADTPPNTLNKETDIEKNVHDNTNIQDKSSQIASENITEQPILLVNNSDTPTNTLNKETEIEKNVQDNTNIRDKSSQIASENITEQPSLLVNNSNPPPNTLNKETEIEKNIQVNINNQDKSSQIASKSVDTPLNNTLINETKTEKKSQSVQNITNNLNKPNQIENENVTKQSNGVVNNAEIPHNIISSDASIDKTVKDNTVNQDKSNQILTENITKLQSAVDNNNNDTLPNIIGNNDINNINKSEYITSPSSLLVPNTDTSQNVTSPAISSNENDVNVNKPPEKTENYSHDVTENIEEKNNINIEKINDSTTQSIIPEINLLNKTSSSIKENENINTNNENIAIQINNAVDAVITTDQIIEMFTNENQNELVIGDKSESQNPILESSGNSSESLNNITESPEEYSKNILDNNVKYTVTESEQIENVLANDPYRMTTKQMDQPIVTNWFSSINNIKPDEPIINDADKPAIPPISQYFTTIDNLNDVASSTPKPDPVNNLLNQRTFDSSTDFLSEQPIEASKYSEEETLTVEDNQESFLVNIKDSLYSLYNNIIEIVHNSQIYKTETSINEKTVEGNYAPNVLPDSEPPSDFKLLWNINELSTDFIFWIIVSAISVLIFTLGYYYLENKKQDKKLLGMINSLQKELMCSSKETIILKEELTLTKEKLMGIEDSSFGTDEMVNCLKKELAETQQTVEELQEKLNAAEDELVNSAEAALELKTIFDEQMSSKDAGSNSLSFTVSNLQSQLDDQQTTMNLIKTQLATKMEENELLTLSFNEISQQKIILDNEIQQLHTKVKNIREENDNKNIQIKELTHNVEKSLQQAENQRQSELNELHLQINKLRDELNESKVLLKTHNEKNLSLQESLKLLKIDENNVSKILDVSDTKASLEKAISEKDVLIETLEREKQYVNELSIKVENQNKDLINMKDRLNDAEQQALQATSRLEVLTNYFNQKEADLLKELNSKETQWHMRQGETMSTVEKIKNLQDEVQQYKDTTESIQRELAEQEASWKAKVATLERRSHEQWLARRAAERLAEASSKEAQTLRQRLAAPSPDTRVTSPVKNTENSSETSLMSPLPGILPPPMGFLPPPFGGPMILPPPLPPLHRPAPLGRLSSPPPSVMHSNRYTNDTRYSPDRGSNPDTRRSTPQHHMRSFSPHNSHRREPYPSRYNDDRYYDSEDDHQSRHYDETETDMSPPPSPRVRQSVPRNHKGTSSGSGQSTESLERVSKRSGKY